MFFISDQEKQAEAGEKVFLDYMLDKNRRNLIYQEWRASLNELNKIMGRINRANWDKISLIELSVLWNEFHRLYIDFWTTGMAPELGNYGYKNFFEAKLKKMASNESELISLLEILTAPEELSFYQQEEIDLKNRKLFLSAGKLRKAV